MVEWRKLNIRAQLRDHQSQILAARSAAIVALKYDVAEAVQVNASKVITAVAGNDSEV
jgi:hypothetical protein